MKVFGVEKTVVEMIEKLDGGSYRIPGCFTSVRGNYCSFFSHNYNFIRKESVYETGFISRHIWEVSGEGEITGGCVTFIVSVHIYDNCYSNRQCFRLDNNCLISWSFESCVGWSGTNFLFLSLIVQFSLSPD